MTNPLTDAQLDDIKARANDYAEGHTHLKVLCGPACAMATAVPALVAEVRRLRAQLAATRTKVLAAEADEIVAHCPDHGSRDTVRISCYCDVADDMRRRAGAAPVSA